MVKSWLTMELIYGTIFNNIWVSCAHAVSLVIYGDPEHHLFVCHLNVHALTLIHYSVHLQVFLWRCTNHIFHVHDSNQSSGLREHWARQHETALVSFPGLCILRGGKRRPGIHCFYMLIILTKILLNRLFPSKSVCCLHHCHEVTNGALYTTCPLSEVPSFPKCISYTLQMLCLKNITLTKQLQSAMKATYGGN